MKYSDDDIRKAVTESHSYREVCRRLGVKLTGGTVGLISIRIKQMSIDTKHFVSNGSWNSGRRKSTEEVLRKRNDGGRARSAQLRRALLEIGRSYKCSGDKCSIQDVWLGSPIILEIDHVDGNPLNDSAENLRFICPNCHSQKRE